MTDAALTTADDVLSRLNNGDVAGVWFRSVQFEPGQTSKKAGAEPEVFVTAYDGEGFLDVDATMA